MKIFIIAFSLIFSTLCVEGAVLWQENFNTGTSNFSDVSGMTRNFGNTYSCQSGNYVIYTSSSYAYAKTKTINVTQGKGIRLSFDSRRVNSSAGSISVYYLITGDCSWDRLNPNNNGWVFWGTITPNISSGVATGCTTQSLQLESHVCGGQNIAILLYFPSASSTNWISIDNVVVDDMGPTSIPVPIISGSTSYVENFTTNKWYGPVNTGNFATSGVTIPYHSYRSSSSAYTYLWNNGCNGTGNHAGVFSDYFAAFYTGYEYCNSGGASQIITKELNTSSCPNPMIKFAYKAKYPCTTGDYSNTFDENYKLYSPKLYTSIGQGYNWVEQPVNYYFPDGLWHFAAYSVPSAANIKVKLTRGGACSNPIEGVDQIKVFCEDCRISQLSGGTISGEPNPNPNQDYTYSITPTTYATYYKWMVRCIDRTPPVVIEAACPNGNDPCIVSGQGTTNVVINFGSNQEHYRVMCIPYDAHPGTLINPSDACYAAISLFPVTTLPVEWGYFILEEKNNGVVLKWKTYSETNNKAFEVQKSFDSEFFNSIAHLQGAGNSNIELEYSYYDENSETGIIYYRIKQIDFDGNESFSDVLSIINENPTSGISINTVFNQDITVYTEMNILYPVQMELYGVNGSLVFRSLPFTLGEGESQNFKVPPVSDGIYFLHLFGAGVDKKMRIIKNSSEF